MLGPILIAVGAYLGGGIYYVAQRMGRDRSHPGALVSPSPLKIASVVLSWAPACLAATARYARTGWRPALSYFVADAGAPFALVAGILLIALALR